MSSTVSLPGPAIRPGYAWALQIEAGDGSAVFPDGSRWRAHVRYYPTAKQILADLTTEEGGLVRVSDTVIEVRLTGAQTAAIASSNVTLDLTRTDMATSLPLGPIFTVPVEPTVTRILA